MSLKVTKNSLITDHFKSVSVYLRLGKELRPCKGKVEIKRLLRDIRRKDIYFMWSKQALIYSFWEAQGHIWRVLTHAISRVNGITMHSGSMSHKAK